MPSGLLCSAQGLESTNGIMRIEDGPTHPVEHQVQKEYTGKEMAFCHSPPLFRLPAEKAPISLKALCPSGPENLLILCPQVITMTTWVLTWAEPLMKSQAQPCLVLSLQVPVQTSILRAISSLLRGTQGEGALQNTVSNLAESTRACPRLV